jgi:hypothetical protein
MKKLLIIASFMLSLINTTSVLAKLPWDDEGIFYRAIVSKSDVSFRTDPYEKRIGKDLGKELVNQYGAVPDIFIIEDYPEKIRMNWIVILMLDYENLWTGTEIDMKGSDTLKWGDINKYFYWRLESLKSGEVLFSQITHGDHNYKMDRHIRRSMLSSSWSNYIKLDANELPIPNDGSAYKLSVYTCKDDPYLDNGLELPIERPHRATIIARISNFTPLHGYVWADINGVFHDNPDKKLLLQLEKEFKYEQTILRSLINLFHDEKNADSLRWAGQLYLKSLNLEEDYRCEKENLRTLAIRFYEENNEDSLKWADHLYLNLMSRNIFYLPRQKDICGNLYRKKVEEKPEVIIGAFWADDRKSETTLEWLHRLLYEVSGDTTIYK